MDLITRPVAPDPFELAAKRFERSGVAHYLNDPVGFATKCVFWPPGQGLTPYQAEVLAALPIRKRVAVRGPHGLGKTGLKALAVWWFALTREANQIDWKCITTAGAWRQLISYLWPEIRKWSLRVNWELVGRPPLRDGDELLDLSIKLRHGSAFAVASTNHALIEGAHADHILYIFDESKAIRAHTWEAAEGAFSGQGVALALAGSTPGPPQGTFYDIQSRKPGYEDWWPRAVSVHEAIDAGRISPEWALQRAKQWGGCTKTITDRTHQCNSTCDANSAAFANRVLGLFHASDEDSVVPLSWVEQAIERWHDWDMSGRPEPKGIEVVGVDVARGGRAKTCVAPRLGHVVRDVYEYRLNDSIKVAAIVMQKHMLNQTDLAVVDVIGVGSGVHDQIRRTPGRQVIAFSAARGTKRRDRSGQFGFVNQRAAMWWRMREALDPAYGPVLCLPPVDELIGDLTAPKWWVTPSNQIQVEPKDEIEKRIGRSTDYGDAVCQSLLTETDFDALHESVIENTAYNYTALPEQAGSGFVYGGDWTEWGSR